MATAKRKPRYSAEQIKKTIADRNRKLKKGTYRLRLLGAVKKDPKAPKYNLAHQMAYALVKEDGELTNVKATNYVTFPFSNEDVEGHEPPNTPGLVIPVVQAHFPDECPRYPRRDPKSKKLMYNGEEISPEEKAACEEEAAIAAWDKMDELLDNPELWPIGDDKGKKDVWAQLYYQVDDSGLESNFPSLRYFSAEEPTGKYAPVPDDQWYEGNSAGGKSTGRTGKKKAAGLKGSRAKKKTSKKKGSSKIRR